MTSFLVGAPAVVGAPFLCKVHNSTYFSREMFVQIDEKKILKTA